MKTRAQACNEWFHGLNPKSQEPGPDVGEAFRAGWNAHAAVTDGPCGWIASQLRMGRKVVALVRPDEDHHGPRYAGYYCEEYAGN